METGKLKILFLFNTFQSIVFTIASAICFCSCFFFLLLAAFCFADALYNLNFVHILVSCGVLILSFIMLLLGSAFFKQSWSHKEKEDDV